jgi:hypothetical protein
MSRPSCRRGAAIAPAGGLQPSSATGSWLPDEAFRHLRLSDARSLQWASVWGCARSTRRPDSLAVTATPFASDPASDVSSAATRTRGSRAETPQPLGGPSDASAKHGGKHERWNQQRRAIVKRRFHKRERHGWLKTARRLSASLALLHLAQGLRRVAPRQMIWFEGPAFGLGRPGGARMLRRRARPSMERALA